MVTFQDQDVPVKPDGSNDLECILDLARWSPSGDNSQPWKFRILGACEIGIDLAHKPTVYEFNEMPPLLVGGFLLETIAIAASHFGRKISYHCDARGDRKYHLTVSFSEEALPEDDLFPYLKIRAVNRWPYQLKKISAEQKSALEKHIGGTLNVQWLDDVSSRMKMGVLTGLSSNIRLSIEEAYQVHVSILDFENHFSRDRIPAASLGVSPATRNIMHWAMQRWARMDTLNKYFGASFLSQLEMDYIPAFFSSAFCVFSWPAPLLADQREQGYLEAGRSLQRFWLELTRQGMVMQPAFAPICFSFYAKNNVRFTQNRTMQDRAGLLLKKFEEIIPLDAAACIARVGFPGPFPVVSRSLRRPLQELMG